MGMALYHAEHGSWRTQSFLGSNLLGKAAAVAPILRSHRDPPAPVVGWLAKMVAPDRAVIDRAPTAFDRFRLLVPYYDIWRRKLAGGLSEQSGATSGDPIALDRAMLDASLHAIAAAPDAYVADVTLNFAALWWLPDAMTHAQLARFRAFVDALGPLPDLGRYPNWHQEHNDAAVWALRLFMMAAGIGSCWWGWRVAASALIGVSVPPIARLGFLAALLVHASFLLTAAAVRAGIPRYAWAMGPALSVLAAASPLAVWRASVQTRDRKFNATPRQRESATR
jgi:hypothetical protein